MSDTFISESATHLHVYLFLSKGQRKTGKALGSQENQAGGYEQIISTGKKSQSE